MRLLVKGNLSDVMSPELQSTKSIEVCGQCSLRFFFLAEKVKLLML